MKKKVEEVSRSVFAGHWESELKSKLQSDLTSPLYAIWTTLPSSFFFLFLLSFCCLFSVTLKVQMRLDLCPGHWVNSLEKQFLDASPGTVAPDRWTLRLEKRFCSLKPAQWPKRCFAWISRQHGRWWNSFRRWKRIGTAPSSRLSASTKRDSQCWLRVVLDVRSLPSEGLWAACLLLLVCTY